MLKLARIGEPVLSPDGAQVAFAVQTVDLDKKNASAPANASPAAH